MVSKTITIGQCSIYICCAASDTYRELVDADERDGVSRPGSQTKLYAPVRASAPLHGS
jgi:hypothetical protein